MLTITETELFTWVAAFIWPLIRISSLLLTMPLVSMRAVPATVRIVIAIILTLFMMPLLPPMASVEMFSYTGLIIALQQLLIGIVIGFILQVVFAAVVFAGQGVALSMGLGFAVLVDPSNGEQVPVVPQFYVMVTTLVFLGVDGHLVVLKMLLDSFVSLPIAKVGFSLDDIWVIAAWTSRLFAAGLLLAMPLVVSLLLVNIAFGVASRAAPQLNVFSIGFPVSLFLGILLIWLSLPSILDEFPGILVEAYDFIEKLLQL